MSQLLASGILKSTTHLQKACFSVFRIQFFRVNDVETSYIISFLRCHNTPISTLWLVLVLSARGMLACERIGPA